MSTFLNSKHVLTILVLLCVTGFSPALSAQGASVETASTEEKTAAQTAFVEGDRAFDVQDYKAALEHFKASYEMVKSPNSRLMVARSLLELGRLDEAYDEFLGVISDAGETPVYTETRETAERERDALLSRLAWLTVDMSGLKPGAVLTVAQRVRDETNQNAELAVTPGLTLVEARWEDGDLAQAEVHLAAGRRAKVKLIIGQTVRVGDVSPPPPQLVEGPSAPQPKGPQATEVEAKPASLIPWAIIAGAVGVAGGATFGAFGGMSKAKFNQLSEVCDDGACPAGSQKDIDQGRRNQLIANIGLGVGVAGLATSAVLFIMQAKRQPKKTELSLGLGHINLRGKF